MSDLWEPGTPEELRDAEAIAGTAAYESDEQWHERVEAEELADAEPEVTGLGATGTPGTPPAPGSESTAQAAPSETLTYVERAQAALVALGGVQLGNLAPELLDRLTVLVLVKGDRCTASDLHDADMVALHRDPSLAEEPGAAREVLPFDVLDPREQQGFERLAQLVQRAGRFVGRDGS